MKMKILIVDDCNSIQTIISSFLSPEFDFSGASSAEEGLASLKIKPVDMVVLDLNMPGMGGEAMLREIRMDDAMKNTRVLILSAEASSSVKTRLINAGAEDYMTKPFNPEELKARINRILSR